MKGVRRGLKSRQQRDQLATLDRGSGENVGSTCREGTPAGPFARPDVRPGGESALGTAGSTFSPVVGQNSIPRLRDRRMARPVNADLVFSDCARAMHLRRGAAGKTTGCRRPRVSVSADRPRFP